VHHLGAAAGTVGGHEDLLAGGGHAEEEQVGAAAPDEVGDRGSLVLGVIAVMTAGDAQIGMPAADVLDHALQHLGPRTEEVDRAALLLRHGEQALKQVDARHSLGQGPAQHPAGPHHGLPVRDDQAAAQDGIAQGGVAA
jgi:hypothetical protein